MEKLMIPENIPLRWEAFRGFGFAELLRSMVVFAVVVTGLVVYNVVSTSPIKMLTSVVIVLFFAAVCAGLFAKQQNNLSMYDYIRLSMRFAKQQKRYYSQPEELIYAEKEN